MITEVIRSSTGPNSTKMKKEKALSIILDPKTINLVGGPGLVGVLKSVFKDHFKK